ncbi:MAG: glycosyltransferase family 1 protein [Thiothrix sp.]|nr:MAG: glycosyltransferase family 1 protein [Thiothrix sp.]
MYSLPCSPITCLTRLAVVTETWPPEINGVAHTLQHLIQGLLVKGNYQITLIRPQQNRQDQALQTARFQEILVHGFRLPFYQQVRLGYPHYLRLKHLWQTQRPDLVQIVTEGPLGYAALRAARKLNLPVVSDFHTRFEQYSGHYSIAKLAAWVERYLRHLHNQTLLTLVPTQELARQLQSKGYERLTVIERGIDQNLFKPTRRNPALRSQLGLQPNQLLVCLVSRLAPEKNLDLAFLAFRAIQDVVPDARFLIVGDGPERSRLQAMHPDCLFVGMQTGTALAEHYASGDLFLYPSTSETFGNVILEAMASGLPVIAFDYAAAHQYIHSYENGCSVTFNDSQAFIQNAVELALNPSLRQQLANEASLSMQGLSWQRVADALHQTFQTLLQELKHETIAPLKCA